jgi:aryl-alcohol dehydrogenase-like predicted oxidoreductase
MKAWSKLGFGAYKCSGTPQQRAALQAALAAGINVIDTSADFKDGASEAMIGEELQAIDQPVTLVTKFGYAKEPEEGSPKLRGHVRPRDSHRVMPGILYSLHPEFMEQQLIASTKRLRRRPDVYMVHNPETYVSCLIEQAQQKLGKEVDLRAAPDAMMLQDAR